MAIRVRNGDGIHRWRNDSQRLENLRAERRASVPFSFCAHHRCPVTRFYGEESAFETHQSSPFFQASLFENFERVCELGLNYVQEIFHGVLEFQSGYFFRGTTLILTLPSTATASILCDNR